MPGPGPAADPVEPQWFGADLDSQLGRSPAVFLDQSETWQYVAGRISTKDDMENGHGHDGDVSIYTVVFLFDVTWKFHYS